MRFANLPHHLPLTALQAADICLHSGGAVLFHPLRHMTVNVQRESGGCVAEISLHRLYIIPVLEGQDGESVTEVMHPAVRRSNLSGQPLIVEIDRLRAQMDSCDRSEHKGGFLFVHVAPCLPKLTGL